MSRRHRVTSVDDHIVGAPPASPTAPVGLTANPAVTSVALTWQRNPETNIASYNVYRQIATVWTVVDNVVDPASTITGLTASTQYFFRVTAVSTVPLESLPSAVVTPTTDAASTGDTLTTFDRTGTTDISDALEIWLNNNTNVPNGTGASTPHRVNFPKFQMDGVTRAVFRIEGGANGGINLGGMVDVTLDGGGSIGGHGLDGAQFISKTKKPFIVQADPTLNPKGIRVGGGASTSTVVPPWQPTVNYPALFIVQKSSRRYKAKLAGAGHDPTDTTTGPTWWTNISPDGILTADVFDFVANGIAVGDHINITIGADPKTRDITGCTVTHGSYIITVPSGTIATTDNGAQVDCAAAGFPTAATANFIDSTHLAIDNYYTGVTGTTTININPKSGTQSTRTITGIKYGANPRAITYGGGSIGSGKPDFIIEPNGTWNTFYTPTSTVSVPYTGSQALGATAWDFADKHAFDLNRARTMFVMSKNTRLRVRGFQFTGPYGFVYDPTLATSGYDPDYESQDAMVWRACNDCEVGDVTIEKMWGNGMEMQPFVENDDTYTPTRGLWLHDSKLQNFGRQSLSLTFGYNAIIEDTYLGESSRSLIDCEPTTTRLGTGTNPVLTWTMQDIQLLRCTIGYHHLGMLSMHEGLGRVHVQNCNGRDIGTSGAAVVDKCIFENNTESPSVLSDYSMIFNTGVHKGGDSIIVRNNAGQASRIAGVHFNADNGPCTNFQVINNLFGTGIAQFADDGGTGGLPFTPFTLPVPAHALRDLAVTTPTAPSAPTGFTATPANTSVALDWNTNPESDLASYNVYRLISSTWTVIHTVTAPTSAYTVTGLTSGVSYSFRVTAVDSGGLESVPSNTLTVTTTTAGTDIPTVTNVIFGNKAAFVTWQKPSSGVTVTSYIVSCTGQADITMAPKVGTWQKAVVRNLLLNNSYTVTIKAVTASGTNPAAGITGTVVWKRPELLTPAGDCITGVAAHGRTLTTYTGSLDLTAGTYDSFLFPGPVTAIEPGVIITRSKIVTGLVGTDGVGVNGFWCNRGSPGPNGGTLEDVEIDGSNPSDAIAAGVETGVYTWGSSTSALHPLVLRRVNVHGCKHMNFTSGFATIEYCYGWDVRNTPGNHADSVQIYNGSNFTFTGNELDFDVTKGETNGLVNACFFVQSSQGAIDNIVADGNLWFGGESTVQLDLRAFAMTNVSLINNMWRRNPLPGGATNPLGGYGPNGDTAGGNGPLFLNHGFSWATNGGPHFNNHYEDNPAAIIPGS